MEKTYFTEGEQPESQMGAALESLAKTIHARSTAGPEAIPIVCSQATLMTS